MENSSSYEYPFNSENYASWRKEHEKVFGEIFSSAFSGNAEAEIQLTAALINITDRNFQGALQKLEELFCLRSSDDDLASLCYFTGLCYEM